VNIKIRHPKSGNSNKPERIAAHFMAYGSKDDAEVPLGVLLSVDSTGAWDKKLQIPGRLIEYKSTNTDPLKNWAMYFNMPPKVSPMQRFTLAVFDSQKLPATIEAQQQVAKSEHLVSRKGRKTKATGHSFANEMGVVEFYGPTSGPPLGPNAGPKAGPHAGPNAGDTAMIVTPSAGDTLNQIQPVAYGYLPAGDNNVDTGNTFLEDTTNANITAVDWSFTDETGFWAVFFDTTTSTQANVVITYTPTGSVEEATDVKLT